MRIQTPAILFSGLLMLYAVHDLHAQPWLRSLNQVSPQAPLSLQAYQSAFDQHWRAKGVVRGHYQEGGLLKKAPGWKQFQRWKWTMENQVDLQTGLMPSASAQEVYTRYLSTLPVQLRSVTAQWTSLGTSYSDGGYAGIGRLNCVAFHPADPNMYWVGAPAGGLWQTRDNGQNWTPLTDQNAVLGVSDIVIPSNFSTSNTIFIATGDRDGFHNYSVGVLKSTNGGQTWQTTGLNFLLTDFYIVYRLILSASNNQHLYAATNGGVYKTLNGGTTWTKISNLIFKDMEFSPGNVNTLYGATTSGQVYVSYNAGEGDWAKSLELDKGQRVELAVSPAEQFRVYALVANQDGGFEGLYRSDNSASSFRKVNQNPVINLLGYERDGSDTTGQGWYDLTMAVSPTNANTLFIGGINTWRSTDAGITWTLVNHWVGDGAQVVHADKHMLRYSPAGVLFECNDGGLYYSNTNGSFWVEKSNGLVISQIYKLGTTRNTTMDVITGLQDNGTKLFTGGLWRDVKGGDGMECLIDYSNADIQYGTYTNGQIDRTDDKWITSQEIQPEDAGEGAWVTPYIIDPMDPRILYAGYADLWKTTNRGNTWTKLSEINSEDRFRSMAIAPSNTQVIYAADGQKVWKTSNGGGQWTDITGSLPVATSRITNLAVHATDANWLWLTMGQYNANRIYESKNGGTTWTNISSGLPNLPIYSVVQNTQITQEIHLYVGSEIGVYLKKGNSPWEPYNHQLPNVKIGELEITYHDNPAQTLLRAATYGRGLWQTPVYYESAGQVAIAPTQVQATDGSFTDKVRISWSGTEGHYFRVFRHTSNSNTTAIPLGSAWINQLLYDDSTAIPGTTYYYWVKSSLNALGNDPSSFSAGDSGYRAKEGVSVPTGVMATDGLFTSKVVVTWQGSENLFYRVFRSTTNTSASATALGTWKKSFTYEDNSAVAGTNYFYWVRSSVSSGGSNPSAFSEPDQGYRAKVIVAVPENVQASDGTFTDKVQISWTGSPGNYFRVFRNTVNNSSTATALGTWKVDTVYADASAIAGTSYYYWVKASASNTGSNPSGFSQSDQGYRAKVVVTIPQNVSATDGLHADKVVVTWTGNPGNYFRVFRNTNNNSNAAVAQGSWQTATAYDDRAANAGNTYYYWVKSAASSTGAGASGFSQGDQGHKTEIMTAIPTNVMASDGYFSDKVLITWEGQSGNYFRVFRNSTDNSATATALSGWQTAKSYNHTSAVKGTLNYYWVKAATSNNGANASGFSNSDSGWRAVGCGRPYGLVAENITGTTCHLLWNAVAGATSYNLWYFDGASWVQFANTSFNSTGIINLVPETPYCFAVSAVCGTTNGLISDGLCIITSVDCPQPTGLTTSNVTQTSCKLSWNAVANATGYGLWYWDGSVWEQFGTSNTNSSAVNNLLPGTTYCFAISTLCGTLQSSLSDFECIRTAGGCPTPTGLVASNITSTTCQLNWNPVNGASEYGVWWLNGDTWESLGVSNTNSTGIIEMSPNTYYCLAVHANCGSQISPLTNGVCFNTLGSKPSASSGRANAWSKMPVLQTGTQDLLISPNPVGPAHTMKVELTNRSGEAYSWAVINLKGQTILHAKGLSDAGVFYFEAPPAAGMYFIRVNYTHGQVLHKKFLVSR